MANKVVFWEKVFNNRDKQGARVPSYPVLVANSAIIMGDSTPICGSCREPEVGHGKRGRKHGYSNPIRGKTLEVTFQNGKTHEVMNVLQGKQANCYTEGA